MPPVGYRQCSVCKIEADAFVVPMASNVAHACEARGMMCGKAQSYMRWQQVATYVFGGGILAFMLGCWWVEHVEREEMRNLRSNEEATRKAHRAYVNGGSARRTGPLEMGGELSWDEEWVVRYKERHAIGHGTCTVQLSRDFGWELSLVGHGKDDDGHFVVENGAVNTETGRFAWSQRAENSSLFAVCQAECANEACDRLEGEYKATTGLSGSFVVERKLAP